MVTLERRKELLQQSLNSLDASRQHILVQKSQVKNRVIRHTKELQALTALVAKQTSPDLASVQQRIQDTERILAEAALETTRLEGLLHAIDARRESLKASRSSSVGSE